MKIFLQLEIVRLANFQSFYFVKIMQKLFLGCKFNDGIESGCREPAASSICQRQSRQHHSTKVIYQNKYFGNKSQSQFALQRFIPTARLSELESKEFFLECVGRASKAAGKSLKQPAIAAAAKYNHFWPRCWLGRRRHSSCDGKNRNVTEKRQQINHFLPPGSVFQLSERACELCGAHENIAT